MAQTLTDKKNIGYVTIANAVASESPSTPDHAKRIAVCREYAVGGGQYDWYIGIDFISQGYNDATSQQTITDRLSALLVNLVALFQ